MPKMSKADSTAFGVLLGVSRNAKAFRMQEVIGIPTPDFFVSLKTWVRTANERAWKMGRCGIVFTNMRQDEKFVWHRAPGEEERRYGVFLAPNEGELLAEVARLRALGWYIDAIVPKYLKETLDTLDRVP